MVDSAFITILITGFSVAFFHAAIPTHWLPFVVAAKGQKWSFGKTLAITALAGGGHVLFTAILGFLVAWCGIALSERVGALFPWIAGGALILFGLFYVWRQVKGKGHSHAHFIGGHSHQAATHDSHCHGNGPHQGIMVDTGHAFVEVSVFETDVPPRFRLFFYNKNKRLLAMPSTGGIKLETVRPGGNRQSFYFRKGSGYLESVSVIPEPHEFDVRLTISHGNHAHSHSASFKEPDSKQAEHQRSCANAQNLIKKSDVAVVASLFALLTFSPCEGFLPVYISGVKYGWTGFALLTCILSLATVAGMIFFTGITLAGMEHFKLQFLEKYESGILGGLLVLLGIILIFLEV